VAGPGTDWRAAAHGATASLIEQLKSIVPTFNPQSTVPVPLATPADEPVPRGLVEEAGA